MTPDRPEQAELAFLARQGILQPDCFRITFGRNSRVWRIETDRGQWILKAYYRHAEDSRDRLGAEVGFLKFLQAHGIQGGPEPVAWSRAQNLGLFSFLPGRKISTVQAWHIARAAAFIGAIFYRGCAESGAADHYVVRDRARLVHISSENLRHLMMPISGLKTAI